MRRLLCFGHKKAARGGPARLIRPPCEGRKGSKTGLLVVGSGRADIVKEFRNLELGRSICFGSELGNRLARGLQCGFFCRTCNVHVDRDVDFGVQAHLDVDKAQRLDRLVLIKASLGAARELG